MTRSTQMVLSSYFLATLSVLTLQGCGVKPERFDDNWFSSFHSDQDLLFGSPSSGSSSHLYHYRETPHSRRTRRDEQRFFDPFLLGHQPPTLSLPELDSGFRRSSESPSDLQVRRNLLPFFEAAVYGASPSPRRIETMSVQERVAFRNTLDAGGWSEDVIRDRPSESIMGGASSRLYRDSVNQLDIRYPMAILPTQALEAFREVDAMIRTFSPGSRAQGENKRQAALRFLAQYQTASGLIDYRDSLTLLNVRQLLSLVWSAIKDSSIYTTEAEREDRKWGLIDTLARIQRAHNDDSLGELNYNPSVPDSPSCPVGTFKRLIEFLDLSHPDVRITDVSSDPALSARSISDSQATDEVRRIHQEHFGSRFLRLANELRDAQFPAARVDEYQVLLRSVVREHAPGISEDQFNRLYPAAVVQSLIDLELSEQEEE